MVPQPAGERPVYLVGNSEGRDRIWLQCDAAGSGQAMAAVAAVLMDSLTSDVPNRYRPLLLGRAQIAVVPPGAVRRVRPPGGRRRPWTPGRCPGAGPCCGRWRASAPRWWCTCRTSRPLRPGSAAPGPSPWPGPACASWRASTWPRTCSGAWPRWKTAGPAYAPGWGAPPPWPGSWRRTRTPAPGPGPGATSRARDTASSRPLPSAWPPATTPPGRPSCAWRPGRYVPRLEWRRLGAASVGEIALSRCGALALCGQTFEDPPAERAGAAVALAEGAVIARLGLDPGGPDG